MELTELRERLKVLVIVGMRNEEHSFRSQVEIKHFKKFLFNY